MPRNPMTSMPVLLFMILGSKTLIGQDLPAVPDGYSISIFAEGLKHALGLAFAPDGNLLVCSWDDGIVYSVDSQGTKTIVNPGMDLIHAAHAVMTTDGRTFVTVGGSSPGAKIWEVIAGNPAPFYEGQGAYGLEWDGAESLYFTQSPTGRILRSDLDGDTTVFASGLESGLADLMFGPDGHLYAANNDNGTIFRIDMSGDVQTYLTNLTRPEMLAFDLEGNLYFTSFTFSKIYKVDAEKNISLFLTGRTDTDIRGIAFDAAGNLFACDQYRGVIYKISRELPGVARFRQTGPRCLSIDLTHSISIKGGEIGISYDPGKAFPVKVSPGPDFPPGGALHVNLNAPVACPSDPSVSAGLTIAWLNPVPGTALLASGSHDLVRICFDLAEGAEVGACSDVRFITCLGPPEAPVRNIVTDEGGNSVLLTTEDGQVCLQEELGFRRGDSNLDGNFDVSDPIGILGCLFLGTHCFSCQDASDANDDGTVNIADPTYLLHWRFLGGPAPPAPFPECAQDPTEDQIEECESAASCP